MTISRVTTLAVAVALMSVSACSALHKKTEAEPAAATAETAAPAAEKIVEPVAAPEKKSKKSKKEKTVKAAASSEAAPAEKAKPAEAKSTVISKDEAMAIAGRGNCLACHKIESKVVGPAWKDVGAKYKGDAKGAATIASHIKAGGSFGWKFGVMPPRGGSQLSDADVEKIAGFIASLR